MDFVSGQIQIAQCFHGKYKEKNLADLDDLRN